MGKKRTCSIDIAPDLVKEILLRLPLKSLVKFKTVSKEWRSILESKSFIEMHLNFQKYVKRRQKILAAYNCDCCDRPNLPPETGSEGDEDLQCNTSRPLMSCDGLVCLPEPGWVNVMNPSTDELVRFPSGPDPVSHYVRPRHVGTLVPYLTYFPGYRAMGFGRDKVTGSYKVVRMSFDPTECDVLSVENGEWRRPLTGSIWGEDRLV
ncbi:unnamed protein product [Arabis nemorensis]|uniref:F-box domain-containing protein n=1 Tax=Arabis nemorensis TaxID=586526 RepID=A0A565B5B3_9BRAS|nr:unnamed protein product [Arabis nemorensis]